MDTSEEAIEMIEDAAITGASDDDDGSPSSPESAYDDGKDLMNIAMGDDVTAQLAAAGPVGVAAAAAIASAKKKKRPHSFETNPSIRKRQQNRLLRKLRQTIFEFATRVGQQAIVLVATPGKPNTSYKVFGAKPLEDVVKNLKSIVMEELETALAQQAPPPPQEDPSLFELPPLIIDGIPTPVEKMTQAQLRAFIPLMLKYSTGRGKPGWGRESTRPQWWPLELPWANVRMDARTEEEKQKISWTHALRKIVINCYKYHGREDLLPAFSEEDEKANILATSNATTTTASNVGVLKFHNGGTVTSASNQQTTKIQIQSPTQTIANAQYTQNMLQTITNADGSLSIIHVDPSNSIITLPDGTTAQVQGVALTTQGEGTTVHTVQGIEGNGQTENMTVDLTEAGLGQENQLIITGEDGQGYPVSVSGMITVPVSSMYQMVANIQHLHQNGDGTVCLTPIQVPQSQLHTSLRHLSGNKVIHATINAAAMAKGLTGQTSSLIYQIKQEATAPTETPSNNNNNNNNHLQGSGGGGVGGGGIPNGATVSVFEPKEEPEESRCNSSAIGHTDSSQPQAIIDSEGNLIIQMRTAPAPPTTTASAAVAAHSTPAQPIKVDFEP
ncbi:DNA-binding protein Ewg isoform X2 [Lutzomyia longipalpis]|uniref:DNA-binding protein Ewg isoform X2 n=1 Tax=Lutzomyia longipalpis TaxID=7200 RepID=UPI002483F41F|nr:DNA-binding protein Ewg isoform X2 [Lutzomyia longipalpis]